MKETNFDPGNANWRSALLALVVLLLTGVASYAGPFSLEGQNKGDTNTWIWSPGNLQNWQELDYIPCRVRISGGPVNNQTFTITFPHITGTTPGFENFYSFTNSANVVFVSGPTLFAPTTGDWSYTFTINVTNSDVASVGFALR